MRDEQSSAHAFPGYNRIQACIDRAYREGTPLTREFVESLLASIEYYAKDNQGLREYASTCTVLVKDADGGNGINGGFIAASTWEERRHALLLSGGPLGVIQ